MPQDAKMPRYGEAVHYVENVGLRCVTALVNGSTHPSSGDDGQWCLSIDTFLAGASAQRRTHTPHGTETGHWHTAQECPNSGRPHGR